MNNKEITMSIIRFGEMLRDAKKSASVTYTGTFTVDDVEFGIMHVTMSCEQQRNSKHHPNPRIELVYELPIRGLEEDHDADSDWAHISRNFRVAFDDQRKDAEESRLVERLIDAIKPDHASLINKLPDLLASGRIDLSNQK